MSQSRVRDAFLGRLRRSDDDRGSIALLMLVILVSSCIGALLLAMLISQNRTTRFASIRVQTLQSAQSGIQVMLGQIRSATSTDSSGVTSGDDDALPCGPMSGSANATGTTTYTVSVAYYLTDPSVAGATAMPCSTGGGPYSLSTGYHTPRFALITSTGTTTLGTGGTAARTLTTTYVLQTDDRNIAGGQFQLYSSTLCMDAGSGQPAAGALVTVQTCSTSAPVAASQAFAYRSDLSIQLVSSVNTTYPAGLCLDTATATHQANSQVVLNPCNALGTAAWNQQWSFDDYGHLQGSLQGTPSPGLDGWTLTAASASAGQPIVLRAGDSNVSSTSQTWVPASNAGTGGAGASNNEIVNFQNFSTCIDVTANVVTTPYLILYSCKQSPNAGAIKWNQKFSPALGPNSPTALPLTSTLATSPAVLPYCLQSPGQLGGYVTLSTSCTTQWTWYQTKDANGAALPYAKVYTIVDPNGYCLSPGPSSDKYSGSYYKIVVTTCDGATDQKWNADPSVLASRLANTGEK